MSADKIIELDHADHHRVMIPCTCCGTCAYFVIDHWAAREDGWDDEFYADMFVRPGPSTLRWRIKAAWRTLLGQMVGQDMSIDAPRAKMLRDWLDGELEQGQ